MFGISFEELLVILILALILFGPDKLPEYAEKLGRLVAKVRQAGTEFTREYQQSFNPSSSQTPQSFGELTCPQCLGKVAGDFNFCPHCGHRLKTLPGTPPPLAS